MKSFYSEKQLESKAAKQLSHAELVSASQDVTGNKPLTLTPLGCSHLVSTMAKPFSHQASPSARNPLFRKRRGNKVAFTLAEVFHPAERSKRIAFTLAEVLITLGIIGVVSAIVMPSLITNINDRINAEKIRSAKYKFTKATDHMKSLGLIGPYSSTDAFVDELQKYFKIAKRCDAEHIRACWPYDNIKTSRGDFNVADAKTGSAFMMRTSDTKDYSSNNVAIITADGTPMILNYNKKCESLDPAKTYGWSTSNGKPESNATAGCVAAVFEINGTSGPNTFRKDVVAFNANGLNGDCAVGIGVNGKCFGAYFGPKPMTYEECAGENATSPYNDTEAGSYAKSLGIKECRYPNDYWAGAVKECGGVNNMPTMEDLGKIASLLYEGNPTVGAEQSVSGTYNGKASEFGLPEPDFEVWAGKEDSPYGAYFRVFSSEGTGWGYNYTRYTYTLLGLCLVD